jgi:DNA-binding MarR family transcriptional regulator
MSEMLSREDIRATVQTQIIECLNRFYAIETGMWGGPLDALIIRTVVVGENQHRLYDLSALANVLDLPIATVHRKVRQLVEAGFMWRERSGRSTYLRPTAKTCVQMDQSFDDMLVTLKRLYRTPTCGRALAG